MLREVNLLSAASYWHRSSRGNVRGDRPPVLVNRSSRPVLRIVTLHRLRSAAPQRAGRHAGAARDHLPLCCARAASSRLMRYNTRLWSYGLFSVGPGLFALAFLQAVSSI